MGSLKSPIDFEVFVKFTFFPTELIDTLMPEAEELRNKINMYTYFLNKYNFYGMFALYLLMKWTSLVSTSSLVIDVYVVLSILVACLVLKSLLKLLFEFKDICECHYGHEKEYSHPKLKTCPPESTVFGVYSDLRFIVEEFMMNVLFRYNLLVPFVISTFCKAKAWTTLNISNLDIFKLMGIVVTPFLVKEAINFFFISQDYCPCDCSSKPIIEPPTCKTDLRNDDLLDEVAQDTSKGTSSGFSETEIPTELRQQVEDELKNLMPDDTSPGRLKDLCTIAVDKLQKFDTVDNCVREIMQDDAARTFAMALLKDDPTYSCLSASTSDTQVESCLKNFFSQRPQYLLRLSTSIA